MEELKLNFIVSIRRNHGVWLPKEQKVRQNKWRKFNRIFSDQAQEIRFVREIVFGKKGFRRYWEVTTDPETLPENSGSYVMIEISSVSYKDIGNLYGSRNWVEYALNMSKNELGWADFRLSCYENVEKWWEIVSSAYLLISLFTPPWKNSAPLLVETSAKPVTEYLVQHPDWDYRTGWKNFLNNLRLINSAFRVFQSHPTLVKGVSHSTIILGLSKAYFFDEFFS